MLLHYVNHEESRRQTSKVSNRTEVLLKFLALTSNLQFLTLGNVVEGAIVHHLIDGGHLLHSLADGGEVGKHTASPTLRDVRHAYALCSSSDNVLTLLLGAYEENLTTAACDSLKSLSSFVDFYYGLVQIDDMDTVALHEDIRSHCRIPFALEVAEVATCFKQLFKIGTSHFFVCELKMNIKIISFRCEYTPSPMSEQWTKAQAPYAGKRPQKPSGYPQQSPGRPKLTSERFGVC